MEYKSDLRERTFIFSVNILKYVGDLPKKRAYRIVGDQLGRCGSSIGANVHEAHGSSSRPEYRRFHEIALKSANETKYWILILKELKGDEEKLIVLYDEAVELAKILGSIVIKLKST